MAGVNQIPKLSYWASSNDVNKMIMTLNQVLLTLQTNIDTVAATPAKAIIAPDFTSLPVDVEDGTLGIARDSSFLYYFSAGNWEKLIV